jgi:hypothetical protein
MNKNPQRDSERRNRGPKPVLSIVVGFNLLLIAVSFSGWFGGTERSLGVADRIFGKIRIGGFRADFVWLVTSTVALSVALLIFIVSARKDRAALINAALCLAEVIAFVLYLHHSLISGVADFG